jgi:hypothetical protein
LVVVFTLETKSGVRVMITISNHFREFLAKEMAIFNVIIQFFAKISMILSKIAKYFAVMYVFKIIALTPCRDE